MSSIIIPLKAEVHKALLYKDNEAWHFEIPANGSSLIFHQKLCCMLSKETQWKDVYLYESKFLRIRARKLTSKKRKTVP